MVCKRRKVVRVVGVVYIDAVIEWIKAFGYDKMDTECLYDYVGNADGLDVHDMTELNE